MISKKILITILATVVVGAGIGGYVYYDHIQTQKQEELEAYEDFKMEYQKYVDILNWMYNDKVDEFAKSLEAYKDKVANKTITDDDKTKLKSIYKDIDKAYADDKAGCEKMYADVSAKHEEAKASLLEEVLSKYDSLKKTYDGWMDKGNYKSALSTLQEMASILTVSETDVTETNVTANTDTNTNKPSNKSNKTNTTANTNATANTNNNSGNTSSNNTTANVPSNNTPSNNSSNDTPLPADGSLGGVVNIDPSQMTGANDYVPSNSSNDVSQPELAQRADEWFATHDNDDNMFQDNPELAQQIWDAMGW